MPDRLASRREFLWQGGAAAVAAAAAAAGVRATPDPGKPMTFPSRRPDPAARHFHSDAVEAEIARVQGRIADPELAWLFGNCFPNTLDTTVSPGRDAQGREDTFVITGDIDAMWLRDSTNQVWQYLPLAKADPALAGLIRGVVRRQAQCVRLDPYANAFNPDPHQHGHWATDRTRILPGIHERKYELDSLCSVLRLSHGYWSATADATPFDADWLAAVDLILHTVIAEQAGSDETPTSPYHFARRTERATDTQPLAGGHTFPWRRTGMSRSPFRPSDDACQFPFLVPANAMAVVCLRNLSAMLGQINRYPDQAARAAQLATEIDAGLRGHAVREHPAHGPVLAYEVDGFGSVSFMDDANVPSLLSLPYLGYCRPDDELYLRTRQLALGPDNPYYSAGKAITGVGGPHVGPGWVWPISITMQALTSTSDDEILACLRQLKATHAGTGFMHEGIWKDDAAKFTRPWFAWANSLFGELVVKVANDRPALLARV